MDTFDNWHLVRELVVLLAFCLFVFFAFLAGVWQSWNAKRQARRMTEQDQPLSVEPKMARAISSTRASSAGRVPRGRSRRR